MRTRAAELAELVESGIDQAVAALRCAVAEDLSFDELTALLTRTITCRNRLDAAVSGVVGTLDTAAEAAKGELTMALSPASWLSYVLHVPASAAHAQVRLARQLPSPPATAAAFSRGELSPHHASTIARAVESVGRGGGDVADAERLMLQEARERDPYDLHRWGLSLLHRLAPREMVAEEERRRQRRHFHLSERFDGGFELAGFLDPIGGVALKTAINGLLGPRPKDDQRTPGQRRADALVELATRVMDSGTLPMRGGERPHLNILVSLETLRGDPGAPAALLNHGFPISGVAARELSGDAIARLIVVDVRGDPLHMGRRFRTAPPKLSDALTIRDGHCAWPGCDRPPAWCQRDHEKPWAAGGPTDIDSMRLLCVPHHGRLGKGWRLERLPDRRVVVRPPPRL